MLESTVSELIVHSYFKKLEKSLRSDFIIAGAGPSGLVAGAFLARAGKNVTLFERKTAPGGGIWGGGMLFNDVVIQKEAAAVLEELGLTVPEEKDGLITIDAVTLASGLIYRAAESGLTILNGVSVEDVVFSGEKKVGGAVINWAPVHREGLHVDPITATAEAVLDATGHPCEITRILSGKNKVRLDTASGSIEGEQSMMAEEAEKTTIDNTVEIYPGLFISGMAANGVRGSFRMGPIFGGMLLSGKKAARLMLERYGRD
jgi:thiamine thiazole synthase